MLLHSRDTNGFKHLSSDLITKYINHTKESIQMWKHNERTLGLMFNAHFKTEIMFIQSKVLCNMRGDNNHCLRSVFKGLKNETRNTFPQWLTNIFHKINCFFGELQVQSAEKKKEDNAFFGQNTAREIVSTSHFSKFLEVLSTVEPVLATGTSYKTFMSPNHLIPRYFRIYFTSNNESVLGQHHISFPHTLPQSVVISVAGK